MSSNESQCSVIVNDIFDELKTENNRLLSEMSFDKRLINVLQNIRNYSLKLNNDCKCKQNSIVLKKFNEFNELFIDLFASQTLSSQDITQKTYHCKPRHHSRGSEDEDNTEEQIDSDSNHESEHTSDRVVIPDSTSSPTFLCSQCNQTFNSELNLKEHKKSVHRYRPFQSNGTEVTENNSTIDSTNDSDVHNTGVHLKTKPFVCQVCDRRLSAKENLLNHLYIEHKIWSFKCHICGIKFSSNKNLIAHFTTHDTTQERNGYIDVITEEANLPLDTQREEQPQEQQEDQRKTTTITQVEETETSDTKSLTIESNDKSNGSLIETKERSDETQGSSVSPLPELLKSTEPKSLLVIVCQKCRKEFSSEEDLTTHLSSEHKLVPFECHLCDYKTSLKPNLVYHTYDHFRCDWDGCEQKFFNERNLNLHRMAIHGVSGPQNSATIPVIDFYTTRAEFNQTDTHCKDRSIIEFERYLTSDYGNRVKTLELKNRLSTASLSVPNQKSPAKRLRRSVPTLEAEDKEKDTKFKIKKLISTPNRSDRSLRSASKPKPSKNQSTEDLKVNLKSNQPKNKEKVESSDSRRKYLLRDRVTNQKMKHRNYGLKTCLKNTNTSSRLRSTEGTKSKNTIYLTRRLTRQSLICVWDGCGRRFRTKLAMDWHMNNAHKSIVSQTTIPKSSSAEKPRPKSLVRPNARTISLRSANCRPLLGCDYNDCDRYFETEAELNRHKQFHESALLIGVAAN